MQSIITITTEGIICDVNQAAQDLLRVGHVLLGKHISFVLGDGEPAKEAVRQAFIGGLPKDSRLRMKDAEGKYIDVLCNASLNQKGNGAVHSVAIVFEACAVNKVELALGIVKGASDAIFSSTLDGTITTWNNAACVLFNRTEQEAIGINLATLFACEKGDIENLVRAVTNAPRVNQVELKQEHSGQQKYVSIEFSRVLGRDNELMGISAICRDVTHDKLQIANIEHEFKTIVQTNKMLSEHASDLSRQAAQMELFAEMAGLLQVCETVEEVYFLICRIASKLYPHSNGVLTTTSDTSLILKVMAHWGSPNMQDFARADCFASHKAESHLTTMNGNDDVRCPHIPQRDGTYLCAPLILRGELVGVLTVHWQAAEIVSDSTALAGRLLGDAALALANLRLKDELQEMAIRDSLTGLYNRRHMAEFLNRELARCHRRRQPLSVILFDVDHFKLFNDRNGHHAGDAVLRAVGKLTDGMVRAGDIGCRYGGEEFLIILPELEIDSAVQRAELIRRTAETMKVEYAQKILPQVTLSLGVAAFPLHGTTPEKLIAEADSALYSAKRLGRNRVVLAAPDELSDDWVEPPVRSL